MKDQSILLVEDVDEIRDALKELLESSGYHVVTASNGREALDHLETMPAPRLILLDLMMPVMSGWEFLDHRQKCGKLSSIPVVVTTAAGEGKIHEVSNAEAVIKKPIDFSALMGWVERFCGIRNELPSLN